jgi:lactoylglutathione lyase
MKIKLIVIKTNKLEELAKFYSDLGLKFEYHQHERGVFHYAAVIDDFVFEIYPLPKNIIVPDATTRLGFEVADLDDILFKLREKGVKIITEPMFTEYGYVSIIEDLDGRKIELSQIIKLN